MRKRDWGWRDGVGGMRRRGEGRWTEGKWGGDGSVLGVWGMGKRWGGASGRVCRGMCWWGGGEVGESGDGYEFMKGEGGGEGKG